MSGLRFRPDPFATVQQPRWLVVSTMFRAVLSSREIPPGSDLHAVMRQAAEDVRADGWEPEGVGDWGFFFARRGTARVEVCLQHCAPGTEYSGPSLHGKMKYVRRSCGR